MSALASYPGDVVRVDGVREILRPSCGIARWQGICVSCGVYLPTRYYVELHAELRDCVIGTICPLHGPEATHQ